MRKLLAALLVVTVAGTVRRAGAQSDAPPKPAFATRIVTSDSLSLSNATESPDGSWILFSSAIRTGPTHLWIMPAGGGAPKRLTDGNYYDHAPVWFPSGKRIAFASTRVRGVMTADIDPASGRLTSPLKRVSLENTGFLDISPDGKRIVYVDDRNRLRLIPGVGGKEVTLLEHRGILMAPRFSRDGRDVYVSSQDPDRKTATLFRVPVSGGAATTALTAPYDNRSWSIVANPVHDRVIVSTSTNTSILTVAGDTVAVMPRIPEPWRISANFSRDGRRYYRAVNGSATIVRVMPTAGGKSVDVTNGSDDYPVTWSADSKRLYSQIGDTSITKSKRGLYVSAIDGTESRFLPMADIDTTRTGPLSGLRYVSADARYWWLTPSPWNSPFSILAYDTKAGQAHVVTRTAMGIASGPGGFHVGPELLYVERHASDGPYELRSVRGTQASPPLHTFSPLGAPVSVAVNRERLAFGIRAGDSTVLYTARMMGTEQRLAAVGGGVSNLSWSPDGRALGAIVTTKAGSRAVYAVLFVHVTEDGKLSGTPRLVPTGASWDLYWLPDSRSVAVLDEQDHTDQTRVLRVPMEEGQQPMSLTPNEKLTFWDQYPSPDGRHVAIPVEQFRSSTLWSIDVDAAAKAWREKKTQTSSSPKTQ